MSAAAVPGQDPPAVAAPAPRRVLALLRGVWRGAVADKVAEGRLRATGWPYGFGAVVVACGVLYVIAAGLAVGSAALRRTGALAVPDSLASSSPVSVVWLLIFLMVACLAVLHVAGIHGPWWLKIIASLINIGQLIIWAGTAAFLQGPPLFVVVSAVLIIGVLVLTVLRARRSVAWWEFPAVLLLAGGVVGIALITMSRNTVTFGYQFTPLYLDQLVGYLGFFVQPAAFAAGVAVAEIAVAATVVATRQTQRLTRRAWPYVILGLVVAARLAQVGWQLATFDPVDSGWFAILPALGLVAAFAGWALVLRRVRPADGPRAQVSELPDDVARVGLPVGATLFGLQVPVLLLLTAVQVLIVAVPQVGRTWSFDPSVLVSQVIDGLRLVIGVVLLALSIRLARRARPGIALVLGCAGLVVIGLTARLLTGYRFALWLDPDALNLVATVVVLVATVVYAARRRLTAARAVALAGAMVLCALFSSRDFVSDPVGAVLGYSGVALVLFGLTWDFLTGSSWANGESRRFPRPVRVLLMLGYTLLTATLLAYGALVRKPGGTGELNAVAELGDLVLGTALLAAALVAVLGTVRDERPVG